MSRFMIPLLLLLLLGGSVFSSVAASECETSNPLLRAVEVASRDFQHRIERRYRDGSNLGTYLSQLRNYSVGYSVNAKLAVVVFLPIDRDGTLDGGGAEYHIDRSTFQIIYVQGYK